MQGIDPLIFYGLCTVGCVGTSLQDVLLNSINVLQLLRPGAGAIIGPTIGGTLWRITHRNSMKLIDARDREFYKHIQKNRADPTAQSAVNPVPDFYGPLQNHFLLRFFMFDYIHVLGEKIGSLHEYRQVRECMY
jgi:mitochondrial import inner membrane translocase subunit TIM23